MENNKHLTLILKVKDKNQYTQKYGKKLKKLIKKVDEFSNYDKDYDVISLKLMIFYH